jgi:hypothetical protein
MRPAPGDMRLAPGDMRLVPGDTRPAPETMRLEYPETISLLVIMNIE